MGGWQQPRKEVPRWKTTARRPYWQTRPGYPMIAGHPQRYGNAAGWPASRRPFLYRHRYQLVPFIWIAAVTAAGGTAYLTRQPGYGVLAGLGGGILIVLGTRHLKGTTRKLATEMAFLSLWVIVIAYAGMPPPVRVGLVASFIAVAFPWWRHFRVRRDRGTLTDEQIFAKLADARRWAGKLGRRESIPSGRRYEIVLDGTETHMGELLAHPRTIAAAYSTSVTQCYVEPDPAGVESRGRLTILSRGTLEKVREHDGSGIDPKTGTAVIGRFADGADARIRFFARNDGTRHGIIAGTTGAGKSALLDLLLYIALADPGRVPVVPIVLDPQNGQSLPAWRDRVMYASGVDECMEMLTRIHAGLLARSRALADMTWDDEGHWVRGMPFFDFDLAGMPIILVIADEFPLLLTSKLHGLEAVRLTAEIAKLGRKAGVSLWPVAQVPSLSELGDQVVRSMLVGGNVVCLRTGDHVSAGMIGLHADPADLPRYFPNGEFTYGVGYIIGPDDRQAVARTDLPPKAARRKQYQVPPLDTRFEEAVRGVAWQAPLVLVPEPPDDDGPPGRRCEDAVLAVLTGEMGKGDIIAGVNRLATGEWGRRPFALRTVSDALASLTMSGRVRKTRHGQYEPGTAQLTPTS